MQLPSYYECNLSTYVGFIQLYIKKCNDFNDLKNDKLSNIMV